MLRFFFAGLATVGGVVLLFFMSFGGMQGTWQSLQHKVAAPASPPSRTAASPGTAIHQVAAPQMQRQSVSRPEPKSLQHSPQAEIDALQSRLHAASQAMVALHSQTEQQHQQLTRLQQQHDVDESLVARLKRQQAAAAAAAAQAKAQQQAAEQHLRQAKAQQQQAEQAQQAAAAAAAAQAKAQQQAAEQQLRQARVQQRQAEQVAARQATRQRAELARQRQATVRQAPAKAVAAQAAPARRQADEHAASSAVAERNSTHAAAASQRNVADNRTDNSLGAVLARLHREVAANRQPHPAPSPSPAAQYAPIPNPPPITPSRERLSRARTAILHGRLQEAQQLLEEAQLQLIFRPVGPNGQTESSGSQSATDVARALSALGAGRSDAALRYLDQAMAEIGTPGNNVMAGMRQP